MPDEPSKMIRVPTPLIEAVRELSRLHRQGRTKAVLEGVEKLVIVIDSESLTLSISIVLKIRYRSSPNAWSDWNQSRAIANKISISLTLIC